jgi:FHA domain
MMPSLHLFHGTHSWPLDTRPITVGRLPECDVVLENDRISRTHAYLIPIPEGVLLVDRSRHGTLVNGEVRHGPSLLADGDELSMAEEILHIRTAATRSSVEREGAGQRSLGRRVREWLRRYGPSEVLGTVVAVGIAGLVKEAIGSSLAAGYLGTIAEAIVYYGVMFLRESIREANLAGRHGRSYGSADLLAVLRNLGLEFGAAEALDTGIIRPLCIGLGIQFIGGSLGALAGKLAADIAFYGPVLTIYEWRLARNHARSQDRKRRTTAAGFPPPEE